MEHSDSVKPTLKCCHISTKGHLVYTATSLLDLITIYPDLAFPHLLIKTLTLAHNVVPLLRQVEGDTCHPQPQAGTPARLSCPRMSC